MRTPHLGCVAALAVFSFSNATAGCQLQQIDNRALDLDVGVTRRFAKMGLAP